MSRLLAYVRGLPEGCRLCMRGAKLVVFVTGVCPERCFYCPISPARMGRRVVYVDEEPAGGIRDVLWEADSIGAEGASITGGEPLTAPRRVRLVASALKDAYGEEFHIHLYTGGSMLTREMLRWLEGVVDEVRVHPRTPEQWLHVLGLAEYRLREGLEISLGVEVPVIPGRGGELLEWIRRLDGKVDFINLNEFEWAPHTATRLEELGFRLGRGGAVAGSFEEAMRLLAEAAETTREVMLHYCSSRYKDVVQLRLRNLRKALRTRRGYEVVLAEGLVSFLEPAGGVPAVYRDYCSLDGSRCWPLLGLRGCIVEAYPSRSRSPEVSRRCLGSG